MPHAELDECAGSVFIPPGRDATHVDLLRMDYQDIVRLEYDREDRPLVRRI